MPKYNLSYTLLSNYRDYKNGTYCGLLFDAVFIKKTTKIEFPDPSHPVNMGKYFEYLCTGYIPEDGILEPAKTKTGTLIAAFQYIVAQVNNYNKFIDSISKQGERIYGAKLTLELNGVTVKCITDVITDNYIVDIKASGNFGRWDDGWGQEPEWLAKSPRMLQAKFNIYLVWRATGNILPFIFAVFSTKNDYEFKLIEVNMTEGSLMAFEEELRTDKNMLDFDVEVGFEAHPSLEQCRECPLRETCEVRCEVPEPIKITL